MSKIKAFLLAAFVLTLLVASAALAWAKPEAAPQSPAVDYSIPWWSVDNGGGVSLGDSYRLSGTIGQPDTSTSTGDSYTLHGGFWSGSFSYNTFVPLLAR